jgi:hypothetical protein
MQVSGDGIAMNLDHKRYAPYSPLLRIRYQILFYGGIGSLQKPVLLSDKEKEDHEKFPHCDRQGISLKDGLRITVILCRKLRDR